ncbi:MAG: discoidin domain-containing protein [Deltaproteobacteria bacterium]|nr:discoidin domain-containing protein [Deltaproteobacteria bacterium]
MKFGARGRSLGSAWIALILGLLSTACGDNRGPESVHRALPNRNVLQTSDGVQYQAHEVIVKPAAGLAATDLDPLLASMGASRSQEAVDPAWPYLKIQLPASMTADEAIVQLRAAGLVQSAERNFIIMPFANAVTPNDPRFGELWGLKKIQAPEAWSFGTGSATIVVGISDTGVDYNHPDLAANIWTNPGEIAGNGKDDDNNGYVDDVRGWDWLNNDNDPMDDHGHGTHVSGTIGAVGNEGVGVAGINWRVKLVPLRFLGSSGGTLWAGAQTILYAAKIKARVLNASWGCSGPSCYSSYLEDAIKQLNTAGGLFAAAAGNNYGNNNDSYPTYPANYDVANVLVVAATDSNDNLANFSNYGPTKVHIAAPGVSILSSLPGNKYAAWNGTSMATPHVAGVAALILSNQPNLTVAQLRDKILSTADKVSALTGKVSSGARLNAQKAVFADNVPSAVPANLKATPGVRNDVTVTFDAVADADVAAYRVFWGTTSLAYTEQRDLAIDQTQLYLSGLPAGKTHFFTVQAIDRAGNASAKAPEVSAGIVDATPPPQVIDLQANTIPGNPALVHVSTASGQFSSYWAASFAADGNIDTAWVSPGRFVPQEESIVVALESPYMIDRVELTPPPAYPQFFPIDFDIDVSPDGQDWTTVGGMRNAKVGAGQTLPIFFPGTFAAAVRVRVLTSRVHDSGLSYAGIAEIAVREMSSNPDGIELRFTAPGDDPGSGAATTYELRYSTSPITESNFSAATRVNTSQPAVSGLTEIVSVAGMAGESGYYFAVRAIDDGNNVSPLSNVAHTQPLTIPPGGINDLRQSDGGPTWVKLSWTAPGGDGALGRAANYEIRMSSEPITPGNFGAAPLLPNLPLPSVSGTTDNYVVENLQANVVYYVAARAFDAQGTVGPVSNVVTLRLETTPDTTPPAIIKELQVYPSQAQRKLSMVAESSSSSLSTSLIASRLVDGNIDTAWVATSEALDTPAWVVFDLGSTTALTRVRMNPGLTSSNLAAYPQAFEWQASADKQNWVALAQVQDYKGRLGEWDEWSFAPTSTRYLRLWISKRGVAGGVGPQYVWLGEVEAYALTPELEVDLTWLAPGDDDYVGTATRYDLRVGNGHITEATFASATPVTTGVPRQGGNIEVLHLPPLQREALQCFRLTATDNANNTSGLSNEACLQTPGIPPAPTSDLAASSVSRNAVTLTWTATGDDGLLGTASAYELRYSTQFITPDRWNLASAFAVDAPRAPGSKETATVTGLASNTTYYFAVKVVDDMGNRSLVSNVVSAQTLDGMTPAGVVDLSAKVVTSEQTAPAAATLLESTGAYSSQTKGDNVLDGDVNTAWISAARAAITEESLRVGFASAKAIGKVRLRAAPGYVDLFPVDFRVETRPDATSEWTPVISETGFTSAGDWEEWAIGRATALEVRLVVTKTKTWAGAYYTALGELEIYEDGGDSTRLQLTWTATGDDGTVGKATSYDVRRASSSITAASFTAATRLTGAPTPRTSGSLERMDATGLTPRTQHCFALTATDDVGLTSPISNSACATTPGLPPGTILDLSVGALSANSAVLSFTAPAQGSSAASRYDVRFSTARINSSNWDQATPATGLLAPKAPGAAESITISGLAGVTTYYFAARAVDADGVSGAPSNNAKGRTLDNIAPSAASGLVATTVTSAGGTIRVAFTAPGDNGPVGQALRYDVRVSPTDINASNFANATPVAAPTPKAGGQTEAFDISGLGAEQLYFVALRAVDAAGNVSDLSNTASARTRDEAPSAISDLTFTGGSGTQNAYLVLQWTAPGDDGSLGTATAYEIRYSTTAITASTFAQATLAAAPPLPSISGSKQTYTLTGLQPGTKYYAAMRAVDDRGVVSAMSNVASFSLPDEWAPDAITDLVAQTGISRGTVKLTWTAPGDDGRTGKATKYELRYSSSPLTTANFAAGTLLTVPTPSAGGTVSTTTLGGLPDETQLYFAMRAQDDGGNWSGVSNSAAARTPDVAPAAIANLAVVARTNSSVTLSFTAPGDDGSVGTASSYALRFSSQPITDLLFNTATTAAAPAPAVAGSQQTVTISGLQSTTTYYVAIKATDERGNVSALSNVLAASTVDEIPPATITNLVATTGSGTGTVVLTFTAPGDDGPQGRATSYEIRRSEAPVNAANFGSATLVSGAPSPSIAGASETVTVSGLRGETIYHFAVRTIDDANLTGGVSNSASASTRAVPPAAVVDLKAVASAGAATLTWTAPGDDGNEGQATSYDLRISTQTITQQNFDQATTVPAPAPALAGSVQSTKLTGLLESTTYYFALKTKDDLGTWSGISNVPQVTTPDVTAPSAPLNLQVRAPDPRDTTVLPIKGEASSILGPPWNVTYAVDGNEMTSWASAGSADDVARTLTVELEATKDIDRVRLLPDTFYPGLFPRDFTIEVSQDKQTWQTVAIEEEFSSSTASWLTWGFAPKTARFVRLSTYATNISDGQHYALVGDVQTQEADWTDGRAMLTWVAPGDDGAKGTATSYEIYYATTPFDASSLASAKQVVGPPKPGAVGSLQSMTATGLQGEATYYWAVRAIDEAGNAGPLSNVVASKTNNVAPGIVSNLTAKTLSANRVSLTWTAPGDDNLTGKATSYEFRYATYALGTQNFPLATLATGAPVPANPGTSQTFEIANLLPGKVYRFAMVTRDEAGNTSYVSNVAVTTTTRAADTTAPDVITDLQVRLPQAAGEPLPATASASSSAQAPQFPATALTDGDTNTAWASAARTQDQLEWVRLDLGTSKAIDHVSLWPASTQSDLFPRGIDIAVSNNGLSWLVVSSLKGIVAVAGQPVVAAFANQSVRYIEVRATSLASYSNGLYYGVIAEAEVTSAQEPPGTIYTSFTSPADDDATGRAASYEMRMSPCPWNYPAAWLLTTSAPQTAGTPERYRFTNISKGEKCIAVRSKDAAGNTSAWSAPAAFTMP